MRARFDLGRRPALVAGMGVDVPPVAGRRGLPRPSRARPALRSSTPGASTPARAARRCSRIYERYRRQRRGRRRPRPDRAAGPARAAPGRACATWATCPRRRRPRPWPGPAPSSARAPTRASPSSCSRGWPSASPASSTRAPTVLKEHCLRSNAGLFYEDADEFVEALDLLVREEPAARRPSARTAAATWRRSTAGTSCSSAGGGCWRRCGESGPSLARGLPGPAEPDELSRPAAGGLAARAGGRPRRPRCP